VVTSGMTRRATTNTASSARQFVNPTETMTKPSVTATMRLNSQTFELRNMHASVQSEL